MTIKEGFKFGIGFMLAYAIYKALILLAALATGGFAALMMMGTN